MTLGLGLATVCGGFLFPFVIRMAWGKMVDHWGPIGGWMAALFIVGTVWCKNRRSRYGRIIRRIVIVFILIKKYQKKYILQGEWEYETVNQ